MTATPSPRARRTRASTAKPLTTADVAPARHLTEAQFRKQVCDLLSLYGYRWSYLPDSRKVQGYPGIPDIQAVRGDGRLIYLELKTAHGRLRQEQRAWLADLNAVPGVGVFIARPASLDYLTEVLR